MKYFATLITLLFVLNVFSQTGYNKKVPVKIDRYDIALFSNTDFTENFIAKKALVNNSGKLTIDEFKRAMSLAQETNFPEGINAVKEQIDREKDILKYNAYWQGSWVESNPAEGWAQTMHLIWIPQEDNKHMPADMIPADKDGIFFVLANRGISMDSLPKSTVPKPAFISEMKQKHNKLKAVVIDSASSKVMSGYGDNMEFAYDTLVVKGKYSDAEFARIAELATDKYWPMPFQSRKYDDAHMQAFADISKYKTYRVATFNDSWNKVALYWVPKEENKHMPVAMQPLTDEGFFIATKVESREDPYLTFSVRSTTPRGRLGYAIAGTPRVNNKSTLKITTIPYTATSSTTSSAGIATTTSTAIKSDGTNEGSVQHKERKRMYISDENTIWTMAKLNNEAVAKTALETSGLYSSKDFARIATLANQDSYPGAISTYQMGKQNMEMVRNYNAYQVANFATSYAPYALLWIPKSENMHMPSEMQPTSDDGFYMLVQQKGVTPIKLGSSMTAARGMENLQSSKTYTTSSGIQVSSADMSQFTNNRRLGVMMLYYGSGGKASSIYMYELRGKELTDRQAVASELASKISGSNFIGFEWLAGYNCDMAKGFVYKKTNSTDGTRCMGEYKID